VKDYNGRRIKAVIRISLAVVKSNMDETIMKIVKNNPKQ
jgi:hypothetical protein